MACNINNDNETGYQEPFEDGALDEDGESGIAKPDLNEAMPPNQVPPNINSTSEDGKLMWTTFVDSINSCARVTVVKANMTLKKHLQPISKNGAQSLFSNTSLHEIFEDHIITSSMNK